MRAVSWMGVSTRANDVELLLAERSDTYAVYRSAESGDGVTAARGQETALGTLTGRVDALRAWEIAQVAETGAQVATLVFLGRMGETITLQRGDRLVGSDGASLRVVTVSDFDWKVEARLSRVD